MNVLETEWWNLVVPPEWWAEAEEDSIVIGDQDDVGCIEISSLHKREGDFEAAEVAAIARDEAEQDLQWDKVTLGDLTGVMSAYAIDGTAIREWYVASGSLLLFITYSCDVENAGMDDAAVDEILDTLLVASSA